MLFDLSNFIHKRKPPPFPCVTDDLQGNGAVGCGLAKLEVRSKTLSRFTRLLKPVEDMRGHAQRAYSIKGSCVDLEVNRSVLNPTPVNKIVKWISVWDTWAGKPGVFQSIWFDPGFIGHGYFTRRNRRSSESPLGQE
ncbi:MAG: hypothetical protein CEO12_301 [Parcubacteria group bacterium Gr01-1014_46]|nr:MAG: hypothetical protein CEO12_301 [Parcubacteria group bacterium Gr01-1014_46]